MENVHVLRFEFDHVATFKHVTNMEGQNLNGLRRKILAILEDL